MDNRPVIETLRGLADSLETGCWREWTAEMVQTRPTVELDPTAGECEHDGLRHFRSGDEVTVTLVLTAPRGTSSLGD